MIHTMKRHVITTNLRLTADELDQYRTIAAELGLSFNEFVRRVLQVCSHPGAGMVKKTITTTYKDDPFWKLNGLMNTSKDSEAHDLSEEDKTIYDI